MKHTLKHTLSGSRARRRPYHGSNLNFNPNTSPRPLQDRKACYNCPPIPPHTPPPLQDPYSLTAPAHDDYDTFSPPFIPSSSSPSLLRRTINRIRLVIGTLLIVPGILIIAPLELFDLDDFLSCFKKGTLPHL